MSNKKIHWNHPKINGNRFLKLPHQNMLSDEGMTETRLLTLIKPEGKKKVEVDVIYDRQYVIEFLATKAFKYLIHIKTDDLVSLINEAIALRKQEIAKMVEENLATTIN